MKRLLAITILLSACAGPQLSMRAKQVRVLRQSDAPMECLEVGTATVPGLQYFTDDAKTAALKDQVDKMNANTAQITKVDGNGTIYATVFNCPRKG